MKNSGGLALVFVALLFFAAIAVCMSPEFVEHDSCCVAQPSGMNIGSQSF